MWFVTNLLKMTYLQYVARVNSCAQSKDFKTFAQVSFHSLICRRDGQFQGLGNKKKRMVAMRLEQALSSTGFFQFQAVTV